MPGQCNHRYLGARLCLRIEKQQLLKGRGIAEQVSNCSINHWEDYEKPERKRQSASQLRELGEKELVRGKHLLSQFGQAADSLVCGQACWCRTKSQADKGPDFVTGQDRPLQDATPNTGPAAPLIALFPLC
jgi:hypothetical protein